MPCQRNDAYVFWREFPSVHRAVYFCHYVGEASKWLFTRWFMKLLGWMKWGRGRSGTNFQTCGVKAERTWTLAIVGYIVASRVPQRVWQKELERAGRSQRNFSLSLGYPKASYKSLSFKGDSSVFLISVEPGRVTRSRPRDVVWEMEKSWWVSLCG